MSVPSLPSQPVLPQADEKYTSGFFNRYSNALRLFFNQLVSYIASLKGYFDTLYPTLISADLTLYVRTDGSDSNDGLTNTAAGAFLTGQAAVDAAYEMLDPNYCVEIKFADGTYTGAVSVQGAMQATGRKSSSFPNYFVVLNGNSGTPSNVHINVTGGIAALRSSTGAFLSVRNLKVSHTGGGSVCLMADSNGMADYTNVVWGAASGGVNDAHMGVFEGGIIYAYGNSEIVGGAANHMSVWGNGYIEGGSNTTTLTGTPAFSDAFVGIGLNSTLYHGGGVFSGAATGKRFSVYQGSVVTGIGNSATYFPGNANGVLQDNAEYGQYFQPSRVATVATLPAAGAPFAGCVASVTDATVTTFASIVAGGGANMVPVYCDGTNWRIG